MFLCSSKMRNVYPLTALRSLVREHNRAIKRDNKIYMSNVAKASRSSLENFIKRHFHILPLHVIKGKSHQFRSKNNRIGVEKVLTNKRK